MSNTQFFGIPTKTVLEIGSIFSDCLSSVVFGSDNLVHMLDKKLKFHGSFAVVATSSR